jgi:large subunit ribosomal protein L13
VGVIDAQGLVVGRLASVVAMRLRGKHKAELHAPRRLRRQRHRHQRRQGGVHRPQARAEGVLPSHRLSGGIKERTARFILDGRFPERVVEKAVERMLPRGPLFRQIMGNLRVYGGAEHPHSAQQPEALDVAALNSKNVRV